MSRHVLDRALFDRKIAPLRVGNGGGIWTHLIHGSLSLPPIGQGMQPILGAKSAEIGDTPSFFGLAFHNG